MTIERVAISRASPGIPPGPRSEGMLSSGTVRRWNRPSCRLISSTRRTERSSRACVISPRATAAAMALIAVLGIGRLQQEVGAGENARTAASGAVGVGHATHVERVGDHQALEAERVAQDAGEDARGDGARPQRPSIDARQARCGPT